MGIFIKTQKFMNVQPNIFWQHTECAHMDGHGYVTNYATLNGGDEFNNLIRRYYYGYRFDDTNSPVTTFAQPTTEGMKLSATSTDGVDVMTTGGEGSISGGNSSIVEQFRADTAFFVTKTNSPVLTEGRERAIGTASWKNSHFNIGGQRATNNPRTAIDAIHYATNAQTVSQGNLSFAGKNPTGCGNGTAAIYRNQDTLHQIMEVINISDHTAGAGTNFISQIKGATSLVAINNLGSAVSTGPDAVFIANTMVTSIPWDDTGVEATWAVSLSTNHNRGGAATDGDTIVLTGGLNGATDTIRYIQADSASTVVTASAQSLDIAMKQHTMVAYQ